MTHSILSENRHSGKSTVKTIISFCNNHYVHLVVIVVFAFLLNWYYGHRAVPAGNVVGFDCGYQDHLGAVPFVDYFSSQGLLICMIQGRFFDVFGVSWGAYVAHASVFNALFGCMVYGFLRTLGLGGAMAMIYGIGSGVIFYTPVAVPIADKHSTFFTLAMIAAQVVALRTNGKGWVFVWYFFAASAGLLGAVAKANPLVVAAIMIPPLALALPRNYWLHAIAGGLTAIFGAFALLTLLEAPLSETLRHVYYYLWELPSQVGARRVLENSQINPYVVFSLLETRPRSLLLGGAFATTSFVALMWWWRMDGDKTDRDKTVYWSTLSLGLGLGFGLIILFHINNIQNIPDIWVALAFTSLGCLHVSVLKVAKLYLAQFETSGRTPMVVIAPTLAIVTFVFVTVDSMYFNIEFNSKRAGAAGNYYWFNYDDRQPRGYIGIKGFENIEWIGSNKKYDWLAHSRALMAYLEQTEDDVFLLGYGRGGRIFYGLSGKNSIWPVMYHEQGHSMPAKGTPEFTHITSVFYRRLTAAGIRHLVMNKQFMKQHLNFIDKLDICKQVTSPYLEAVTLCGPISRELSDLIFDFHAV